MFKLIIFVFCLASCATKTEKKDVKVISFKINKKENVIELRYNNGEVKYMYSNRVV